MKPIIYFLLNSLDVDRGGLTRASLKQASFFAQSGYETHILTFNFNQNYPMIRQQLLEMKKVHKDVIIHNMYEELSGSKRPLISGAAPKKVSINDVAEGLPYDKRKGHDAYRIYKNGAYYKYVRFHELGSVEYIDYYDENRYRIKRVYFDVWGHIKKVAFMHLLSNQPRQSIYYTNDGRAYLTQWHNTSGDKTIRTILFNEDSSVKKHYVADSEVLKIDWLTNIINKNKNRSVIVSDTRSTDKILADFNHPNAAKILRLHSNHVTTPYQTDSELSHKVAVAFENLASYDVTVFLTDQQKKDVIERTNWKDNNFAVIPHYHDVQTSKFKNIFNPTKTDKKLGVIISRLTTLKRTADVIKAYEIVTNKIPDVRLEIWGTGTQSGNLQKLINSLGLEKNISLMGYTRTPDEIYKKGLFSVLTSKAEGFALSIIESMYNKTPVISYDIRYGPNDMIVDKVNGFLVDNGNIKVLAERIIWMYENPEKAVVMGDKAKKYINKHFNRDIYKKKWLEVIDLALTNKFGSEL